MNRRLVQSALFSLGAHALLLAPAAGVPGSGSFPQTDVVRGVSSVELELQDAPPSSFEGGGEEKRAAVRPAPAAASADEQGASVRSPALTGLRNAPPRYPRLARLQGWEGTVILRVGIRPDGGVKSLEVRSGSGHTVLDQAAAEAVRQWRFLPAYRKGKPVSAQVEIPITFTLRRFS